MTREAINPLRQRMIEDMTLRNFAPRTQESYIRAVKRFASFLEHSPDQGTAEDIRRFQLHLAGSGMSIGNMNRTMTGFGLLLRVTLNRPQIAAQIQSAREPKEAAGRVLNPEEGSPLECSAGSQGQGCLEGALWRRTACLRGGLAQDPATSTARDHRHLLTKPQC